VPLVVPQRRLPNPEASRYLTDQQLQCAHDMHLALNPGSGPILAYVKPHPTSVRRDRAPWALLTAGLAAQLVGVATEGLWHGLLAGRTSGVLTEDRAFWMVHSISNAGVISVIIGSILLHRRYPSPSTRVVLAGAAAETLGALLDAYAHARGGENPVAFGLIGAGFLLVAGGGIAAWRTRRGVATKPASRVLTDREQGAR